MLHIKKSIKFLRTIMFFGIFSTCLYSQTWTPVSGTGSFVNKIVFIDNNANKIIVCSDIVPTDFNQFNIEFPNFGVGNNGYKMSTDGGNSFGSEILKGYSVYDVLQSKKNPLNWLASVRKGSRGAIISSTDGGNSWNEEIKGCDESWQIVNLFDNSENNVVLGAAVNTGAGLRFSADNFVTCDNFKNVDISSRNLVASALDPNMYFAAGDDQYQRGVMRSYDKGQTWLHDSSGLKNLRILCVYPSRYDKSVVYCGADSLNSYKVSIGKGIYQSLDTGKTWHKVGADGARVFQIAEHPKNPKFLAAAGDSTGVWISGTWGWAWENYSTGLPAINFPVRNIAVSPEDANASGIIVYAGTFGSGLYKSSRVKTSINETELGEFQVSPNPVIDYLTISGSEYKFEEIILNPIEVFNQLGMVNYFKSISNDKITINVENLSPGIYFAKVGNKLVKFVKI